MLNALGTVLSVLNACLLLFLIVFLIKFKRGMPDIQEVLDDVGGSISEQLGAIFEKGPVKSAMSVLGKKSGEARADNALRKRVASQAMDQIPGIGLLLKQFNLTPIEGLKLMNDPLIGPLIQRGISAAQSGLGKVLSGTGTGFSASGSSSQRVDYGREE